MLLVAEGFWLKFKFTGGIPMLIIYTMLTIALLISVASMIQNKKVSSHCNSTNDLVASFDLFTQSYEEDQKQKQELLNKFSADFNGFEERLTSLETFTKKLQKVANAS